jgi:hypothetical protein
MESFHQYADNALYNQQTPEAIILNGHTVFWTANKSNSLKDQRMNWIINNFVDYENIDKRPYYTYYKKNITDICQDYEVLDIQAPEQEPIYDDDITIHYQELANKYAALARLNDQLLSKCDEIPECSDAFEYQYSMPESIEYQSTLEYDDEYMETDEEYYERCFDNEQYEDDDYDY